MKNQLMADKLIQLEQMLQEQQTELASLRQALARKTANRVDPAVTAAPVQLKTPDTSRRKMLKRMGLAVLAGGAALGITSATYAPAEARISVNPSPKIGAVITRTGKSITNIPINHNYGLIASADDSFDATGVSPTSSTGIIGFSSDEATSNGVYGYSNGGFAVCGKSNTGYGVAGSSDNWYGVFGDSASQVGVYGQTGTATKPAIKAKNNASTSGIALQIEQGGLTVTGAGVGTGAGASTTTAAFVQKTTSGGGGNITGDFTKIDNPLCNSRPDALLFVTPNLTPNGASGISENKSVAVFYNVGSGFWNIYHEDTSAMVAGVYFNVLIINP